MGKQNWRTPEWFFRPLDEEFHFTIDVAADKDNALCPRYYTEEQDGLSQSWAYETVWCNPPYHDVMPWVRKAAYESMLLDALIVMLLNPCTDTAWFHDHIWDDQRHIPRIGVEIRFIRGRIRFLDDAGQESLGPRNPNMLVIFGKPR